MTMQSAKRPIRGSDLQLSVSGTSARVRLYRSDVSIHCATACFIKLGDSTVVASTSDYDRYIPAGATIDLTNGGNTYIAVVLASGTDTAYINEFE